jgi:pimeloyl-ACP methyl ester carboxylesterase
MKHGDRLIACLGALAFFLGGCFAMESSMASKFARLDGRIVSFDDPLFAVKIQKTGLWKPYRFIKTIGFALFETTDHDPSRIPVVFVHGYVASPESFQTLAAALDGKRFEPIFAYYATGQKLDLAAKGLRCALCELARKRDMDEVIVIAHSMGGLVARAFLGDKTGDPVRPRVPVFISLSTPYGGTEFLEKVKVVQGQPDVWKDLKIGSDFLAHLFDKPLPEETAFHLMVGTKGDSDRLPGPDDGTVTVKSATRKEAMAEAASVYVCPTCTHRGIRQDPEPLEKIMDILSDAYDKAFAAPAATLPVEG